MQLFIVLLFLQFFTLGGYKTWFKRHSIRLTNHALLTSLGVVDGDEHARQKDLNAPLKSLLPRSIRWELMYRATVDHCQQHQRLPSKDYKTSFEGHDDLKLVNWVARQKKRYVGNDAVSALTNDQLNKLMAIDEFREWAEDPLRDDNVRWEFMYRATIDYCQQHQRLPPHNYTTSFEGHDDLKLGRWVAAQKQRYDGNDAVSALTNDQLNKLMAIAEFREWAEDPLRDDDVRWELMYRATIDYCQQRHELPPHNYTTSFEGHDDLNLGRWVTWQKNRYDGSVEQSLSIEELSLLMAIDEFREWAEDLLRDDDVRWELMYRATVEYCQQHQQLPPHNYTTSFEGHDDLKLGNWVVNQKQRYEGNGHWSSFTNDQLNKLMAIDEFRQWAEDPLRDNDVRWELKYRATVNYCQQHRQLPPHNYTTSFEGHDNLNLGSWINAQKQRYDGNDIYSPLTNDQLNKLIAIAEFSEWAKDPLRGADVRWELMHRATVNYCQQRHKLPSHGYQTSFEGHGDLKIGVWVTTQKQRYDGKRDTTSFTNDQLNKMMAIDEFRKWAQDPLHDLDVRWEVHFDLLAEYCYFYHKLPSSTHKAIYEREDGTSQKIELGWWLERQKRAYSGVGTSRITEERHDKLMQIPEFKLWTMGRFGTIRYADFPHVHAKIKKTGSKKKSPPSTQQ